MNTTRAAAAARLAVASLTPPADDTPPTYAKTMMKTRCLLPQSSDCGGNWKLVSTIAADPAAGTEGCGEPVLCRVGTGGKAGKAGWLICFTRAGWPGFRAGVSSGGRRAAGPTNTRPPHDSATRSRPELPRASRDRP